MNAFQMTQGAVDFDGKPILRGIDLTVSDGDVLAVLGPNGSGKSTLIRAMLGLIPLSAGAATIYGVPAERFRDWHRIGYVPQRLSVGGGVPATVREIVSSGRIARRRPFRPLSRTDRHAVDRAMDAVGLAGRARAAVQSLSGGQQQRVLIARALAGEPDVLVMDEPTAGVDSESQAALAKVLAETGTAVVVAHELGPLEAVITRSMTLSARDHAAAEVVDA